MHPSGPLREIDVSCDDRWNAQFQWLGYPTSRHTSHVTAWLITVCYSVSITSKSKSWGEEAGRPKTPCCWRFMGGLKTVCWRVLWLSRGSVCLEKKAFDWLDGAHPRDGKQSAVLSWWKHLSPPDTPRRDTQNTVWPNMWAPHSPVRLVHNMDHGTPESGCWPQMPAPRAHWADMGARGLLVLASTSRWRVNQIYKKKKSWTSWNSKTFLGPMREVRSQDNCSLKSGTMCKYREKLQINWQEAWNRTPIEALTQPLPWVSGGWVGVSLRAEASGDHSLRPTPQANTMRSQEKSPYCLGGEWGTC